MAVGMQAMSMSNVPPTSIYKGIVSLVIIFSCWVHHHNVARVSTACQMCFVDTKTDGMGNT